MQLSTCEVLLFADYALLGHVIEVCTGKDLVCGLQCLRIDKCRSYNCFAVENQKTEICHLNNETRFSKPEDFKKNQGSTYFELTQVGMIIIFLEMNKLILSKLTFLFISPFLSVRHRSCTSTLLHLALSLAFL